MENQFDVTKVPRSNKIRMEDVDYRLILAESDDINAPVPIEILIEKYKDVVYNYNTVRLSEDGVLTFDYTVHTNPHKFDLNETEFKVLIGDILVSLMSQEAEKSTNAGTINDDIDRTNDSSEFVTE